jgi:uncharacterized membrane protein
MGTSFQYGKNLAAEGSVLLLLGLIPYVGWVLGIIGVILFLRGMRELANYFQDSSIYENSLTGVKYYIVALVAAAVAIASIVIGVGTATGFTFKAFTPTIGFGIGLAAFLAGIIVAFVFFILAASNLRRTFDTLAQKSGEHSFSTAATLIWWGSILTILLVGFLIIFISWIFVVIALFSMKPPRQNISVQYLQPPTQPQPTRYCPNCGAPVTLTEPYCPHCGKQLPQ